MDRSVSRNFRWFQVILFLEISYSLEKPREKIRLREECGSPFNIIVMAAGAQEIDQEAITSEGHPPVYKGWLS